ncbi:MAG: HAMP domain-containing protein [Candidatus Omnitrophota bacterium]
MNRTNRRRQYIVNKEFQIKFILRFCLMVILASLAIGLLVFHFTRGSTTVAIENTKVVVKGTQDFILPVILATVLSVAFFASLAVFLSALFSSNRIAGPIYRLSKEIERLKEGDLTGSFKIRSKDEFQELARNLNEMSKILRGHCSELKGKMKGLESFLQERNYSVSGQDKEAFLSQMKEIEGLLDYFQV